MLPSGACADKIIQKIYSNYTLFDAVGGPLRPTSLHDPSESPFSFRLFPNPTDRGLLHLALSGTVVGTMQVQVMDMTGRTMLTQTVEVMPSSSLVPLDVSALPSGKYAVTVATSGHLHTEILSIQ
ncbi:MAG TPA: T9SS type A sorting domain-containing protein [Saprospiraceae bacterium]|nr:T9SS type A sorting domain-containing protein [Saprospiraceae bacterium]